MGNRLTEVGVFDERVNMILGTEVSSLPIRANIPGLKAHLYKKKHFNCIKYLEALSDLLEDPDYVGINPNEESVSFEYVKVIGENIQIAIKLEESGEYFYVASIYDIPEAKLQRRLHSGRLKNFS